MAILFKKTEMLEKQIDGFLDAVSQGMVVFKMAIKNYIDGEKNEFAEHFHTISVLENKADELRRMAENQLYSHSLIPEHRGDVLGVLEHMDDVIDTAKETLNHFLVESPVIYPELNKDFLELAETASLAGESIVLSTRAFFTDVNAVKNHLHKVYFYEKEADKITSRLQRKIFALDIDLSHKLHLKFVARDVDNLSDIAEGVADRLAIYAIKRTL